ncbi:MAG: hypothetical protein J6C37_06430 [Roseburia sp.]|nr:hypothetical protein [Roseburia sp.]
MNKLTVAVCDTEEGYRNRFVTYLVDHKAEEITVHAFSTLEKFLAAIGNHVFDVVLLGRGFDAAQGAVEEQGMPLLRLKDYVPEFVAEEGTYQSGTSARVADVFRYQPMDSILHEMQALMGQRVAVAAAAGRTASKLEVIGVYSPIHHEMQIPFSMIFASLLSEKRSVLYLNFMDYSGFMELFQLEGDCDMGDIILRIRNGRLHPEAFWRCVYETRGVSYIPPFHSAENLHEMTWEDYTEFLTFLEEETDFETVIIDFGDGVNDLMRMLESCSSIYCPMKQGFLFSCQLNQFLAGLAGTWEIPGASGDARPPGDVPPLLGDWEERIHVVELPYSARGIRGGTDVLRQLQWSEFGDYVRKYLTGAEG